MAVGAADRLVASAVTFRSAAPAVERHTSDIALTDAALTDAGTQARRANSLRFTLARMSLAANPMNHADRLWCPVCPSIEILAMDGA